MALNIPNTGAPGTGFLQGIGTGSNMFANLMDPILKREMMKQQQKRYGQLGEQFNQDLGFRQQQEQRRGNEFGQNFGLARERENRAASLLPLQKALQEYQIKKAKMDVDPNEKMNYIRNIMSGIRGLNGPQQQGTNAPGGGGDFVESLSPTDRMALGVAGINVPNPHIYQGAARERSDLEDLRKREGENSPVYQDALASYKNSQKTKQDLSDIRNRTITGLRPGERWMFDDEGNKIGKDVPLTATEKTEYRGRSFFNHVFPYINNGLSALSGEGSINKLNEAANNYSSDPKSKKLIDDWLLGNKLLTAGVVKESSTLGAGKQKSTYGQLRDSLNSSDIPKTIGGIIKQFKLPASAGALANNRFQEILNKGTKAAEKAVPAYQQQLFKPEEQQIGSQETANEMPTNSESSGSAVIVINPDGQQFETTEENAAHLPKGWKRG